MVRRPRALLELLRLSLAPTLVADLCAGVALGAARSGAGRSFDTVAASGLALVARLLPVSFLLFAGGMALNARVDVEEDRVTRPRRPLPSGDVEPAFATLVAAMALPAAPLVAWLCGGEFRRDLTLVAVAMAAAIAVYHTPLKRSPFAGPLLLGAIRGGDLLLGAVGAAGLDRGLAAGLFSAGCYAAYVAGASFIAHQEDRDARAALVRTGALLSLLAIVGHASALLLFPLVAAAADAFSPPVLVAAWHLVSLRGAWVLFRPTGFGLVRVETFARLFLSRMSLLPAAAAFAAGNLALGLSSIVAFFAVFALVRFIPPT